MHKLSRAVRALVLLIAGAGLACTASAETLRLGGSGTAVAVMRQLAAAYRIHHPDVQFVVVPDLGSTGGIQATIANVIDIGVSSRELKEEERKLGITDLPYARSPWVFITPMAQPLNGVSTKDVVDIYTRKRTHWPDGKPIRLVVAPTGDRDNKLLSTLSPEMGKAVDALPTEQLIIGETDSQQADRVEHIPNTIGSTSLAIILVEHHRVKPLPLNGVLPTPQHVENGKYPLYKTYRMVIRKTSAKADAVRQFADFVHSAEGRKLLEQFGHVPIER